LTNVTDFSHRNEIKKKKMQWIWSITAQKVDFTKKNSSK